MKTGSMVLRLTLIAAFVGVAVAPQAWAGSRSGSMRALSQLGRAGSSRMGSRSLRAPSASNLRGVLGSRGGQRSSKGSDGLQNLSDLLEMRRGGYGDRGYGDRSRGYGDWNPYGRNDRYRDPERYYADAMRDAAIINGVVNMVGIIAGAATSPYAAQQPYGRQPVAYGAPYPSPTPGYVTPSYRVERVLVQEGHYEEYQTWVPDTYDQRTGETIKGHYVVRQRFVPEVWQERQVPIHP